MVQVVSLCAATLLAGVVSPAIGADGVTSDTVRIGMINAQSGAVASAGIAVRQGVEAVFADVNAHGGLHGRALELAVADDAYDPERSIAVALDMLRHGDVFALTGLIGTATGAAMLPIVTDLRVPVVGIVSGGEMFREPVAREVFNLRASYRAETEALIEHFAARGAGNFGVLYQNDEFGLSLLEAVETSLARRGLELAVASSYPRDTVAVKTALLAMLETDPDVVLIAGTRRPTGDFVELARQMGLRSQFGTLSVVGAAQFAAAVGRPGNGTVIAQVLPQPDSEEAVVEQCRTLVAAREDTELTDFVLEGCLNALVLVEGLRRAGPELDRQGLIDALESISAFDLGGLTVDFGPNRRDGAEPVYLIRIRSGALEVIE